jgi:hypothetical protein
MRARVLHVALKAERSDKVTLRVTFLTSECKVSVPEHGVREGFLLELLMKAANPPTQAAWWRVQFCLKWIDTTFSETEHKRS